jgi:hypothetical protein
MARDIIRDPRRGDDWWPERLERGGSAGGRVGKHDANAESGCRRFTGSASFLVRVLCAL